MIDWDSGIKPWHLVADAGFGAAMEECGFRKVGRSMWRRDGDRIAWRVALTKGYAGTPGSFRASYGGFVKEIDELVKLYNPKRSLERMEGTSTPMHTGGTLAGDLMEEQKQKDFAPWESKWGNEYRTRSGWKGIWKDLIDPVPKPPEIDYSEIPFLDRAGEYTNEMAFIMKNQDDIEKVADLLIDCWNRITLPWIQERLDFDQLYPRIWGRQAPNKSTWHHYDAEVFAAAKLAGDQSWIDEMARMAFAGSRTSFAEIWEKCRAVGDFDREPVRSGEVSPETIVRNKYESKLMPVVTVIAMAETMNIAIQKEIIDQIEHPWIVGPMRF